MAHPTPQSKEETELEVLQTIKRVCMEMADTIDKGQVGQPLDVHRNFLKALFSRLDIIRKTPRQEMRI